MEREERDQNEDGKIDSWTFFTAAGEIRENRRDRNFDGIVDLIGEYKKGVLDLQKRDENHNGRMEVWDYFQQGKLVRQEQDKNEDGKTGFMALFRC